MGFPLDNKQLILQDTRVHDATADNVDLIVRHTYWWPYGESGLYRPLTTLSYLFNYAVLGNRDRPAGYHVVNLLLHTINVMLLYALMRRLTRPAGVAFAGAAIWAVLPVSTEAVTNIVGRADLLAALAVLGGFLLYLKSRNADGVRRAAWLSGVMAIAAAGLFSKESAVVLVPVIALYEVVWWTRGRSASALRWVAVAMTPLLLLVWMQRSAVLSASPAAEFPFTDNPIAGAGFWVGRLTAINVMGRYLWLLVWPAKLSSDYSYAQVPLSHGSLEDVVACVVIVLFAAGAIACFKRHQAIFFFAAFAFITFVPASNLVFSTGTIMGERLLYLPSIGVVAIFTIALFAAARALGTRFAVAILVMFVVIAFAARTWTRNRDWQNDVTLWTSAVRVTPASAKAHRALAEALYDSDPTHANIDRVIAEAERSVALLAPLPDSLNSFQSYRQAGAYYLDKADDLIRSGPGDSRSTSEEARHAYQRSLELLTRCLAIVTAGSARVPGASTAPAADTYRLLAAAHLGLDEPQQALDAAARARTLGPLQPLAYRLAAAALLAGGRVDDAAVTLMGGIVLTADAGLTQELLGLYRSGLDEQGCAVASTSNGPAFNPACPIVQRHLCAASAESIQVNLQLGRRDQAERLKETAVSQLRCPSEPLERLLPTGR